MSTAIDRLRAAGFFIDGSIVNDGAFHRCRCESDREGKPTGSYRVEEGIVFAHSWRNADEWTSVRLGESAGTPANDIERERARILRSQKNEAQRVETAEGARRIWEQATESDGSHPYLKKKGIKPHNVRRCGGELLIPLHDAEGVLWNFQKIRPDGTKLFPKAGRVRGCFHFIGDLDTAPRALVAEGFATAATLNEATGLPSVVAVDCGNLEHVVDALIKKYPGTEFMICADDDRNTQGNPGVSHALDVAKTHKLRVAVPHGFAEDSRGTDFNDLAVEFSGDEVKRQIETAWNTLPLKFTLAEVMPELAKLSPERLAEESERRAEYFKLTPIEIKRHVSKHRDQAEATGVAAKVDAKAIEPWADPVEGAELLDALAGEFDKFLVLPPHADTILALWTLHTYSWEQCEYSPIVAVTSPVRSCGKSRVLDVLEKLVSNSFRTGNMSEPVLFRVLDARKPSVLIDEFDTIPEDRRDALANILKHGFHRAGRVHRVEGDSEKKVVEFVVFGPKALACIKLSTLDAPTVSRCINIRMQRKKTAQKVARLRRYDGTEWRQKCMRWTQDHRERIEAATAVMPDALGDREQDIYEPLFVLANLAGGNWPEKIKAASLALCGESADAATDSSVSLLGWIQTYFAESGSDKVSNSTLVDWLNAREDAPFSSWNDGKGIGQNEVRRHLAGFDIQPSTIRIGDKTAKGFRRAWFQDAFTAYLPGTPPENGNTVTTLRNIDDSAAFAPVTREQCYRDEKGFPTNKNGHCYPVTAANPKTVSAEVQEVMRI